MQNMSEKRERLEKRLREQLEVQIQQLRGEKAEEKEVGEREELQRIVTDQQERITVLEVDVAKVRVHIWSYDVAVFE